ncbi:MAG: hypothetical protein LUE24_12305 [Lachnospiraceae bacterium]|nr:hypothetical protein [Lachnospiraceae bacterium]
MSRKNTQTLNSIHMMCRMDGLDEKLLYQRSKMILSTYRSICWSAMGRADEVREDLACYCGTELDEALIYLETFAPDEARVRFEERVKTLFETRWMTELVENTMVRVRAYPCSGDLYCELLSKCYLTCFKYRETELLEILDMERSTFYDRKKEAVLLFGLSLWGMAIPRLKAFAREGQAVRQNPD